MPLLILNGKSYSWAELVETPAAPAGLTPYEQHTLRFCRQWLTGQDTFVLRTSGSTGAPKAITLKREQMVASARLTGRALGLREGDRALVCLSTEYIAGLMMLVRGFEWGLALTIIRPARNPLAGFPEATAFEFTALAPLQVQEIMTATPRKTAILNRMRAILVGGAPVSETLLRQLQALNAPVYHTYGMTETVSHIALRRLNGPEASAWFTPLEGVEMGVDPRGCLVVKSILTRYRPLPTQDRVELRSDGSFRWLGRLDHVINSGGLKVQPEAVEAALEKAFQEHRGGLLAGRRFFVGPLPDSRLGQVVVAVIEGPPVKVEILAEIRARLALPSYAVPRHFYFRSRLLETPTGKVDRLANLAQLAADTHGT